MRIQFKLDGASAFGAKIDRISKRMRTNVAKDVAITAEDIVEAARQNLLDNGSYITGNLYDSLTAQQVSDMEYQVGSHVEYAPYVEYGTSHSRPYPYFRPAYFMYQKEFEKRMKRRVREAKYK